MVKKKLFATIKYKFGFLTRTQTTILSAASILAISSGITSLLGLLKNRLLTSHFGVSPELTVFYTADKIPGLIYSLFVAGVLSTVFIPIYAESLKDGKDSAQKFASNILTWGILIFFVLGGIVFAFAEPLIRFISANEFSPAETSLGGNLLRLMLMAQWILLLGSFLTSLGQTHNYFLLPSIAPVLYNLGMILGIAFLSTKYGIYGPAWGVLIGATLYLLVQTPIIAKVEFRYKPQLKIRKKYRNRIKHMVPARIMNILIATGRSVAYNAFAIAIGKPEAIYAKFASQLQTFPISLFGNPIASATLPTLSKNTEETKLERFKQIFITSLFQMLFFIFPSSMLLVILRVPIIRIVYGTAKFPWESTVRTSYMLALIGVSIFAQSTTLLITRAFYALKDTSTPLKLNLVLTPISVVVAYLLHKTTLGTWSLALTYSVVAILEMSILLGLLWKRLGGFDPKSLIYPLVKMGYATLFMGISVYIPLKLLDEYVLDTTKTLQLILVTAVATFFGVIAYLFFTWLFKVKEVILLYKLIGKIKPHKELRRVETKQIPNLEEQLN